jgi:hypothetical protein
MRIHRLLILAIALVFIVGSAMYAQAQNDQTTLYVLNLAGERVRNATFHLASGPIEVDPVQGSISGPFEIETSMLVSISMQQGASFSSFTTGTTVGGTAVYILLPSSSNDSVDFALVDLTDTTAVGVAALDGKARLAVLNKVGTSNVLAAATLTEQSGASSSIVIATGGSGPIGSLNSSLPLETRPSAGFIVSPGTYSLVLTQTANPAEVLYEQSHIVLNAGSISLVVAYGTQNVEVGVYTLTLP